MVFESATGILAVPFPPVVQEIGKSNPLKMPGGEISPLGNLGPALRQKIFREFAAMLPGTLPYDPAVLV